MTNWLRLYHEFNQDLTRHEILLVGEVNGNRYKTGFPIEHPITDLGFNSFIAKLNVALDNVYRVDTAPTV